MSARARFSHTPIQGLVSEAFVKLAAAKQIPMASTLTIGDNYNRIHEHSEFLDQPLYVATMDPKERARLKKVAGEGGSTFRQQAALLAKLAPVDEDANSNSGRQSTPDRCCWRSDCGRHRQFERCGNSTRARIAGQGGIPLVEVIKIATFNAARFLGKQDQMGSIEEGRIADAVLLSADPRADISNCKAIVAVMKAGEIIDESKLPLAGGPQPRRLH